MLPLVLAASMLASLSLTSMGWFSRPETGLLALSMASGVVAAALARGRPLAWFVALSVAFVALSAAGAPEATLPSLPTPSGELARAELAVRRSGCGLDGCWSEAELLECRALEPGSCAPAGTLLGVASEGELPSGARIVALVRLRVRSVFRNPIEHTTWPDTRPRLLATLPAGTRPEVRAQPPIARWVFAARLSAREALSRTLPAPHGGIARALLLGEGAAVEADLSAAIRGAGVSHVLAVSGMHVTLLVGALVSLVRLAWLRTPWASAWEAARVAAGVGALLAPLVSQLCGGAPSAVRAAWTSTLIYSIVALGRKPCARASTGLTLAAFVVVAPRDALHPGFVLSVLATAALLTGPRAGGGVRGALRESARAWLATAPFLLVCFGQTSVVALLANVALLPLGTALVPLAALHLLAALLGIADALATGPLFELASGAFVTAARIGTELDPGLALPPLMPVQALGLTLAAGCLMLPLSSRGRVLGLSLAAASLGLSECLLRHPRGGDRLRVTFLDVGQGDAVLLESSDGHAALVDGGGNPGGGPDPGAGAVLPLLRARRIARLDWVALSHPHPDHYGGLATVIAALRVGELWDTGQAEAEDVPDAPEPSPVARLLERVRAQGGRVLRPDTLCGAPRALGSARIEVLAPCPGFTPTLGPNDNSLVLRVVHGERSFLLTGDIERAAEDALVARRVPLASDVLKVPHHGSRTSSSDGLLEAVTPWLAVVSAGRGNRFGHPHPEVSLRLGAHAAHVLRTDEVGGVEVTSDGHTLTVRTAESSAARQLPVHTPQAARP